MKNLSGSAATIAARSSRGNPQPIVSSSRLSATYTICPTRNFTRPRTSASVVRGSAIATCRICSRVTIVPILAGSADNLTAWPKSGPGLREDDMPVRGSDARGLVVVLAVALTAIAGVTSAFAATTWTVRPGGTISLTSGRFSVKDTTTGSVLTCSSSSAGGTLKSGSGHAGGGIGSVTTLAGKSCAQVGSFTVAGGDLPWRLSLTSYDAATHTVTGNIGGAHLDISGSGCKATVDGTRGTAGDGVVRFTYADGTAKLKLLTTGGNLHIYDVTGCFGLLVSGDPATVSGTFSVSPKQVITSP